MMVLIAYVLAWMVTALRPAELPDDDGAGMSDRRRG